MAIQVEFTGGYTSPLKTKYAPNAPVAVKKEEVFLDADDKNVAVKVIYATAGDDAYTFSYDADGENEVAEADMKNLFEKGVVCNLSNKLYAALTYDETNGINFGLPAIQ